jgi:hypothetical protein
VEIGFKNLDLYGEGAKKAKEVSCICLRLELSHSSATPFNRKSVERVEDVGTFQNLPNHNPA